MRARQLSNLNPKALNHKNHLKCFVQKIGNPTDAVRGFPVFPQGPGAGTFVGDGPQRFLSVRAATTLVPLPVSKLTGAG